MEWVAGDIVSETRENMIILEDGLFQEVRDLGPDLIFRRGENQREIIVVIELSCPHSCMVQGRNAMKRVPEQKRPKYRQMPQELSNLRHEQIRVTAVIVLWLGSAYMQSLKDLHTMLRCDRRQPRRLGLRMSEAATR
jgi:hypothetical protein